VVRGPYAAAALGYRAQGWPGVLPLPRGSKHAPPVGTTGVAAPDPSWPDVYAWAEGDEGTGNVALRLPDHVIGLDVDDYDNRGGGRTLEHAEQVWGALPATWRASSRPDGISGVRLFRVPPGTRFVGTFGAGTDIVQRVHRYLVAPPSVHPTGPVYRWHGPDGQPDSPAPDELPALLTRWVDALTVPAAARATSTPRRRTGRRPAPPASRPSSIERFARAGAHDATWIVAQATDHLRELARAATSAEAVDLAVTAGFLVAQAIATGLADRAEWSAQLRVALHRAPGSNDTLLTAVDTGCQRAAATPWRVAAPQTC
jgi:hypothetical protein